MTTPTLLLWVYAIALGIVSASGSESGQISRRADLAATFGLPFLVAAWVIADARRRGRRLCYDYDSFVYFAWPVVVPIYLFQTRGARALITLLCFAGIWLLAILAAGVVSLIRQF